ncbi:DinB family protein [Parapedobacter sp. ISTM3]|uniref:DinB family protein n=1 Tax=Parapedobacter sp. ISTM3 TaxID=2800130 RepID=UPI0019086D74|nr:DinB family protein [Parapedobacter sp. ISTM3]MBK1441221.1 DinB family protein [Parapedobacter sp. ISTM3]
MDIIKELLTELETEGAITRKMLALVPEDRFDWAPHPKSMTLKQLATHLAEIPSWYALAVDQDELDFNEGAYQPTSIANTTELLALFEKSYQAGKAALQRLPEAALDKPWVMRGGDAVYLDTTKYGMVRHAFAQTIHHRAQLGVFLRLLDIPIPGSYGPSADEMEQ